MRRRRTAPPRSASRTTAPPVSARFGNGDLAASLVLIFPALLAYEIGVLFAGHVNGADVVTRAVYGALGRTPYLVMHAAIAGTFLLWVRRTQRWASLRLEIVGPVLLEAAVYALTLGAVMIMVVDRTAALFSAAAGGVHVAAVGRLLPMGLHLGSIVDALGAGVHEELVFRLGLFGGLVGVLARSLPRRTAIACALVASSVLFAAAHHVGVAGEPFTTHAFAYRCLAGAVFGVIAWQRSLAHAVYAHAMYDLLVYWRT